MIDSSESDWKKSIKDSSNGQHSIFIDNIEPQKSNEKIEIDPE